MGAYNIRPLGILTWVSVLHIWLICSSPIFCRPRKFCLYPSTTFWFILLTDSKHHIIPFIADNNKVDPYHTIDNRLLSWPVMCLTTFSRLIHHGSAYKVTKVTNKNSTSICIVYYMSHYIMKYKSSHQISQMKKNKCTASTAIIGHLFPLLWHSLCAVNHTTSPWYSGCYSSHTHGKYCKTIIHDVK